MPAPTCDATLAALQALPGIGDWTAQYIAMRALRWPDAFPAGDVALQKALGVRQRRAPRARGLAGLAALAQLRGAARLARAASARRLPIHRIERGSPQCPTGTLTSRELPS